MPVTAKLSRDFYDRFGDKVVDELVGLLNDMDATFRAELKELNEQNFQRFDAKLEQRLGILDERFERRVAELRGDLRSEFHREIGSLRGDLFKWSFVFWVGSAATTGGLVFTMLKVML
jgi:hypothetical protein